MWSKSVNRNSFLDIIQGKAPFADDQQYNLGGFFHESDENELNLIWNISPQIQSLPSIIMVDSNRKRDFLAWAATYLPNFRPFTSYFRVFDKSMQILLQTPELKPSLVRYESACLGLILGEAHSYMLEKGDVNSLSTSSFEKTYSFTMAKAVSFGMHNYLKSISDSWMKVRRLTKQPDLILDVKYLESPWAVVQILSSNNSVKSPTLSINNLDDIEKITHACYEILESDNISENTIKAFLRWEPAIETSNVIVDGTREQRVTVFESYVQRIMADKKINSVIASFLCGYFLSQMSSGSFEYYKLIKKDVFNKYPQVLLWYGLCAGLQRNSKLYYFSSGLGRRIMREVLRQENILDRPRCDISIDELELYLSNDDVSIKLQTGLKNILDVEIYPCITSKVQWPPQVYKQADLPNTKVSISSFDELNKLLSEFNISINKVNLLHKDIQRVIEGFQKEQKVPVKKKTSKYNKNKK